MTSVPADPGTRVLRASRQSYRRWLRRSVAGGAALVSLLVLSNLRRVGSLSELILLGGLLLGAPVLALSMVSVHIATSRVTIADGEVEYRRWWRRTVLQPGDHLVGLLAVYLPTITTSPATPVLVARAADGGPRIHLSGAHWDQSDLDEIARALDIPVRDRVLNAKGYQRRAPGALPWQERHPILFGTGGALAVVAVVAAGVLFYWTGHDLPPFDERPPRAVAGTTVDLQDSVVRDVVTAVDGRWTMPVATLRECQDLDDFKGWERRVDVEPIEPPARLTDETVAAVTGAMLRNGYLHLTGSKVRDITGHLLGAAYSEDEVRVELESGSAGITVRGHCEVPATVRAPR